MKPPVTVQGYRSQRVRAEYGRFSPGGILWRRFRHGWLGAAWRFALLLGRLGTRILDLVLAASTLLVLAPLILPIAVLSRVSGHPVLAREPRVGRWGVIFELLEFDSTDGPGQLLGRLHLQHLAALWNVIRGDMSVVGPRACRPEELDLRQWAARKRSNVRPGMVSPWWLRQRANIDFGSELDVDLEYVDRQSVRGDLGIAVRALPAILYGSGSATWPYQVDVLGVPIRNLTMEEALAYILLGAESEAPRQLSFVNTDCVNKAQSDPAYAACLRACDVVLADGIGIRIAGKLLRQEIRQNVNGTDLFPLLCRRLQDRDAGLFLLGARPGVAELVRDWVERNYPGAKVKGLHHGYFGPEEQPAVIEEIRQSGAQILLVAFGSPRQDLWIAEHRGKLGAGIAMGVGGLFDFYSGRIPRAPQWLRELSLEWIYRLWQEPSRMWKRYLLGNLVFLARVMWSILRRRNPAVSAEQ
jgi:N-acetylglucosaminyldiphosphoundecaprenol N-acetyl-beta-D-mannosaminyltransferase